MTEHTTIRLQNAELGVWELVETATGRILDESLSTSPLECSARRYEWTWAMDHTATAATMDALYRAAIATQT